MHLVRYLKKSPGQDILLSAHSDLSLSAYTDSDWATCPQTHRSTTGYITFLGSSPISLKSKKQYMVSHSSVEVKYRAMANAISELLWLRTLFIDFGVSLSPPMQLFYDNQTAIHIATNPVFHERTKHIEIDCHFMHDRI